jgi:hypothetical protein
MAFSAWASSPSSSRIAGAPRRFDDLGRRKADLASIVCPAAPPHATLRKGSAASTDYGIVHRGAWPGVA